MLALQGQWEDPKRSKNLSVPKTGLFVKYRVSQNFRQNLHKFVIIVFSRPRKSHPIRNTLVLLGVTTGAVVGYAKFDSDFRKQVQDTSPAFNEFIKIVTQEERSYEESYNVISNYVSSL